MRQLHPGDEKCAAELAVMLWPHHSIDEMEKEMAAVLGRKDWAVFAQEDGGEAVGFAECSLRHDYVEGTDSTPVAYLEGIFVREGYRRAGMAGEWLAACEKWAREQGCREFASDCGLENGQSLRFHLAMGFQEASRIICFTKKLQEE